jgi:hypothetical protein
MKRDFVAIPTRFHPHPLFVYSYIQYSCDVISNFTEAIPN